MKKTLITLLLGVTSFTSLYGDPSIPKVIPVDTTMSKSLRKIEGIVELIIFPTRDHTGKDSLYNFSYYSPRNINSGGGGRASTLELLSKKLNEQLPREKGILNIVYRHPPSGDTLSTNQVYTVMEALQQKKYREFRPKRNYDYLF